MKQPIADHSVDNPLSVNLEQLMPWNNSFQAFDEFRSRRIVIPFFGVSHSYSAPSAARSDTDSYKSSPQLATLPLKRNSGGTTSGFTPGAVGGVKYPSA